jgi:hypothetical protein
MHISREWYQWLVGSLFGPTNVTRIGVFSVFSHNAYVDMVERLGFFGLIFYFFLLGKTFFSKNSQESESFTFQRLLVLSALVFGFTYMVPTAYFVVIGILLRINHTLEESQISGNAD